MLEKHQKTKNKPHNEKWSYKLTDQEFTQAIINTDAENEPWTSPWLEPGFASIPALLRSGKAQTDPGLALAALSIPSLHHFSALYKHHGQEGVNIGHLQTTTDSGKF